MGAAAGKKAWPQDWSAVEAQVMIVNEGGQVSADGRSVCCAESAFASCTVQLSSGGGKRYMDYTNRRTRLEDPVNGVEVDDYKAHKSYAVVHNGTHDVCQSYCPLDPRDTLDGGAAYFLGPNATDLGAATFRGAAANEWQWEQKIFGKVTMQTSDFYADVASDPKYVLPLGQVVHLTPFGRLPQIGEQNMTWTGFQQGPQPASKFDIAGAATCPENPQCGSPQKQRRRLAAAQYHTFARYFVPVAGN